MRIRDVCMSVAAAVVVAGCSGEMTPLDAKTECVQEFVQDFEYEGPPGHRGIYCPGEEEKYPGETRRRRRFVHTELSGDDVYTRQTLIDWFGEQDATQDYCTRIIRRETVVEYVEEDGERQIRATVDGVRQKKETLTNHRNSLVYLDVYVGGLAPVRSEIDADSIEPTEFGLECAWVDRKIGLSPRSGEACMPVAPFARCKGFDQMMPIEQSGNFGGDFVKGKTTLLKFGREGSVVDKSDWMD